MLKFEISENYGSFKQYSSVEYTALPYVVIKLYLISK